MSMATVNLADIFANLPFAASPVGFFLSLFDESGNINKITPSNIQRSVLAPQATDLDHPDRNGIFSINSSTGTKPCAYGIVFSSGVNDIYQLALGSDHALYYRMSINGNTGSWYRVTASVVSGTAVHVVGGKSLSFNSLRNLAERRVA